MTTILRIAPRSPQPLAAAIALAAMLACAAPAAAQSMQFTQAQATGTIIRVIAGTPTPVAFERVLTDTIGTQDTIPSRAHLSFAWQAEPVPPATAVVSYVIARSFPWGAFEDDTVGADVTTWSIDTAPTGALFGGAGFVRVTAIDDLGHTQTARRNFTMNFAPDTWWAGPDPAAIPVVPGSGGQRYRTVYDWHALAPVEGSLLSCDSLVVRPALRTVRRTFFEIYGNRLYVRAEGDTVHRGAWVVLSSGGYDPDSPYAVHVAPFTPIPDTAACSGGDTPWVIRPGGADGSPIGFRSRVITVQGNGVRVTPAETTLYPTFDVNSVFHLPAVSAYWRVDATGRAYAVARSVDADGGEDPGVGDPVALVQHVEQGTATPQELALRSRVLTFRVLSGGPVGVGPIAAMPLSLEGFRPNPATTDVTIAFTLPDARGASLDVFDTSGRRVWSRRGLAAPGPQVLRVDRALPPGVYLLRLEHGGQVRTARAAIVR